MKLDAAPLALSPQYQQLAARLDPARDGHVYASVAQLKDRYVDFIAGVMPAGGPDFRAMMEKAMGQIEAMNAVAWDLRIDGAEVRERAVLHFPAEARAALGKTYLPQNWKALRFTRKPSTVAFMAQNFDLEAYYDQQVAVMQEVIKAAPEDTRPANPYEMIEGQAKAMGLDLRENVLRALGPDLAFVLDWPEGQPLPELLVLVGVRDAEKFKPAWAVLESTLRTMAVGFGHATDFDAGGLKGVSVHPSQLPVISPTVASGGGYLLLGLSGAGAQRLAAETADTLKPEAMAGGAEPPASSFAGGYADAGALVARGYAAGRPFLAKLLAEAEDERMKAWQGKLPERLEIAPLLGQWSSISYLEGDVLVGDMRSPLGSMIVPASVGVLAGLAVPAMSGAQNKAEAARETSDARQLGVLLFARANDAGGAYPQSLEVLVEQGEVERKLVFDEKSGEPRWLYYGAGLATVSPPQTLLLESVRAFPLKGGQGKVVYDLGNNAKLIPVAEAEALRPAPTAAPAEPPAAPVPAEEIPDAQ